MQLTHRLPAQPLEMPSFLESVQQLALNVSRKASQRASGLSVFDIDDASRRATVKNGLKVRPNPNQALRTV